MLVHKYQHRSMSVYDRLHDKAKIEAKRNFLKQDVNNNSALKDQSRHKSSYLNKSAIGEEINYGSLLYHKGLQKKENRQKLAAHLLQKKLEKEEKDCTFKPQINPISIEIVNSKSRMESTEDHLIRYGKQKREKIDRLRGIRKMEEIEECSFRPEICLISQKIVEEKEKYHPNLEKDKHTKLYEESKLKQAQQELRSRMINDIECTFTPEINTSMNQNVLNTSFEERTKIYVERKEKTMQDIKQKYTKELVDEETQMPYFKPLVGRPPKNQQLAGHNVWSHLYNQRVGLEKNKRELEERYLQQAHSNVVRPSENSELIVRGVRRKRLEEIFQALDSDNDGFISQNRIDISQIPTSVLEILAPIFCEMEEHELTLSLEDFVHQTEELLKTLPVSAKDSLIARKKETSGTPKYDFKPQINQNSERIAQKKRPQTAGTMYDMYYEQQQLLREKLKQEREKKLQEELKKCSFKPIFFTNPHVNRLNHSSSTHLR